MTPNEQGVERDLASPQREAAFFFGLFMRGHDPQQLRQDIDFPAHMLLKLDREPPPTRAEIQQMFEYRKRVLAIFNFLVNSETGRMQ